MADALKMPNPQQNDALTSIPGGVNGSSFSVAPIDSTVAANDPLYTQTPSPEEVERLDTQKKMDHVRQFFKLNPIVAIVAGIFPSNTTAENMSDLIAAMQATRKHTQDAMDEQSAAA